MTVADIAVIAIVLLSGMVAASLGFVRVVLGIGGWIGAGLVTIYGFNFARPIAQDLINSAPLADLAAGGTLFIVSLIVLTIIIHAIARRVRDSGFGVLDRTLGLVAGFAIGAVIVSSSFVILERVMEWPPERDKRPEWVRSARAAPIVEMGADILVSIIPPEWGGGKRGRADPDEQARTARKLMTAPSKPATADEKSGYNMRERREMDRLIHGRQ